MLEFKNIKPSGRGKFGDFARVSGVARRLNLKIGQLAFRAGFGCRKSAARIEKYSSWGYSLVDLSSRCAIYISDTKYLSEFNQTAPGVSGASQENGVSDVGIKSEA